MIFLGLTVACILAFGVLFKMAAVGDVDGLGLVTLNYVFAAAGVGVGLFADGVGVGQNPSLAFVGLGATTGLLFIGGFNLFAIATKKAGMSLSISVMRISVIIPFLYSWWFWSETPGPLQLVGLVVACLSFVLITRPASDPEVTASPQPTAENGVADFGQTDRAGRIRSWAVASLVLLFVTGGLTDVSMKTFDEVFAGLHTRWQFMALVFGTAAVTGLVAMAGLGRFNRTTLTPKLIAMSLVLGLVNIGSVEFLLRAVETLSGTFVFPAISISVVLGGAAIGVLFWKERLGRLNQLGLLLAIVALVLLQA